MDTRQHGVRAASLVVAGSTGLLLLGALRLAAEPFGWRRAYAAVDVTAGRWLLPYRGLVVAAAVVTLVLLAFRRRAVARAAARSAAAGFAARMILHALLAAFVAGSLAHALAGLAQEQFAIRSLFFSTWLLGLAVWMGMVALAPERALRPPGALRRAADLLSINLIGALILAEGAVAAYGKLFPSSMLWNEGSVASKIAANRLPPGTLMFGKPVNSGGYHDEEFFRAGEGDLVVALLADSFGLGVVPYRYHFATVAERRLAEALRGRYLRVAIHNLGIGAIGMPEYAWLLENEVPRWDPAVVVLCVFVGNDIAGLEAVEKRYYNLQNLQLYQLATRVLRVRREGAGAGALQPGPGLGGAPAAPDAGYDPAVERPRFSEATFLAVERRRAEVCRSGGVAAARRWRGFLAALDAFHQRLGERLRVMIIPDEFQVDEPLWEAVREGIDDPQTLRRDLPQERVVAWCRARGVPVLDLLAPLRAAQREEHVYHLRDTHWNAAGNRVAGEALARFLLDSLPDPGPPTAGAAPREATDS